MRWGLNPSWASIHQPPETATTNSMGIVGGRRAERVAGCYPYRGLRHGVGGGGW